MVVLLCMFCDARSHLAAKWSPQIERLWLRRSVIRNYEIELLGGPARSMSPNGGGDVTPVRLGTPIWKPVRYRGETGLSILQDSLFRACADNKVFLSSALKQ